MRIIDRIPQPVIVLFGIMVFIGIIAFIAAAMNREREAMPCKVSQKVMGGAYEIVVIDRCEYFSGSGLLTHKGNCTNHVGRENEDK